MKTSDDRLSRGLVAIAFVAMTLAWLIPNHYPPWVSFYNEAAMGLSLLALFVLSRAHPASGQTPMLAWVIVTVTGLPVLQWVCKPLAFSGDAVIVGVYLLATAVSVAAGYTLADKNGRPLAAVLCLAALTAGCVSSVISLSQSLELAAFGIWAEFATPGMRAVGNLAQSNNLATLLGLSSVAVLYFYERRLLARVPAVALVVLLVTTGALTQSRMSVAFGVVTLAGLFVARRSGLTIRTPVAAVVCLTALHWLLMWSVPALVEAMFQLKMESLAERGIESPRYQMWKMLLHATSTDAPWSGFGWLQVGTAELSVVDQYPPIKELWLQAHNVFVELIVANGWPLGVALSLLLVYWFGSRFARITTLESLLGMLVIGIVGTHSLVEFPYQYAYFLIPVGLWAGLVEFEQGRRAVLGNRAMLVPAGLALALFAGILYQYGPIEDDFRLVRFENARIGNVRAVEPAPAAPLLSSLTAFLRFARTEPVEGMSAAQLAHLEEVVKRYPYAASLVRYASALALNHRLDEARVTFIKIRYIYGDRMYQRMKADLHERAQGVPTLQALDAALPAPHLLAP